MSDKAGDGGQPKVTSDPGAGDSITLNVGGEDKVLTKAEIATAMEKAGNLERTVEGLSGFQKVLTQYGVTPDEYLRNSEASFALANSLIAKGIIDEQGNIVEKKAPAQGDPPPSPVVPQLKDTGLTKQLETIEKALLALGSKVENIEDGQSGLYRRNVSRDVKAAHPELDDDDISKLLGVAQADKSRSFWDHAKDMAQEKSVREATTVNTIAKTTVEALVKAGVIPKDKVPDLENFDLNTLKEQDPSGAAPVYEGKKFMFKSRQRRLGKKAEGFALPSESMKEMFDQKLE